MKTVTVLLAGGEQDLHEAENGVEPTAEHDFMVLTVTARGVAYHYPLSALRCWWTEDDDA